MSLNTCVRRNIFCGFLYAFFFFKRLCFPSCPAAPPTKVPSHLCVCGPLPEGLPENSCYVLSLSGPLAIAAGASDSSRLSWLSTLSDVKITFDCFIFSLY